MRKLDIGTLTIWDDYATYEGTKIEFTVTNTQTVQHVHLSGDINNNWVKVTYKESDEEKIAYFADAKRMGLGNLIGGSEELFYGLYTLVE